MIGHVMIVEDEAKIARVLVDYLEGAGFSTRVLDSGAGLLQELTTDVPDAILLDIGLPGVDGKQLCRLIRQRSTVPIIMVTARTDERDRIEGLSLGADDYVCKPFSPGEVVARVKSVIRRARGKLRPDDAVAVDVGSRTATIRGLQLDLTPAEFNLLATLAAHPGQVFSRDQLLTRAFPDQRDVSDRAIDSHIKNLRKKMAAVPEQPVRITAVYGAGYRLEIAVTSADVSHHQE